ncbi:MAG: hypothetical protein ABR567_00130 [Myxococcales bacterium]|nr:hypothetical protein [Myxococcales bacterium]
MSFERARRLADAVLLEGYVLYPYRASAAKNRFRWSFGVLAPREWSEAGGCEEWWAETQVLVDGDARVEGRLRFLQALSRTVETPDGRAVESLDAQGRLLVSWDEGQLREIDFSDTTRLFELPGGESVEDVRGDGGELLGRVRRKWLPLRGSIDVKRERIDAGYPLSRLTVRIENHTPCADADAPRDEALRGSLIAMHVLLGGAFHSLLDPPDWAKAAATSCRSVRLWPVLAGEPGTRDVLLCAPIILYDHAAIAPESAGNIFDNTEIDEILTLRTMTLTESEKREARATDPRAAALVDQVDGLAPEVLRRLHGALRGLSGGEMVPKIAPGMRVLLRPGARRTDAQDLLYAGRSATVESVRHDVDGTEYLAVTIDGDPAAELNRLHGRFHYYRPDEVELL